MYTQDMVTPSTPTTSTSARKLDSKVQACVAQVWALMDEGASLRMAFIYAVHDHELTDAQAEKAWLEVQAVTGAERLGALDLSNEGGR